MLRAALRRSGLLLLAERPALLRAEAASAVNGRRLCSKPDSGPSFNIPQHRPTDFEKKILLWGGKFKKAADIPEYISYEMVDAAKSKVRVKFSMLMIFLTLAGCVGMVISGKAAVKRHESLVNINLEKHAKVKSEGEK
ncbi:protein FAM162A [Hyperolius riggenbachi]|uniref:protein FAM162A n=1 Tax=Hyperolius riggenbachi TaxID=752182 RepID=UPI0035A394C8